MANTDMAYGAMACIVMADALGLQSKSRIVMAYVFMAYVVMAWIVTVDAPEL